jgi:hypothetical protein
METIGSIIKDEIIPLSISIKKRKKKRALTNREKLWKQVNKKVKKITYTLNPNSRFYEDETQVVCNDFVPDRGYDDDSFQWAEVASNIDWTGLLSVVDTDSYDGECKNEATENPPLLFNFDEFEIEDVVYEKMWN